MQVRSSGLAGRPRYIYGSATACGRPVYLPGSTLQVALGITHLAGREEDFSYPALQSQLIHFQAAPVVIFIADHKFDLISGQKVFNIVVEVFETSPEPGVFRSTILYTRLSTSAIGMAPLVSRELITLITKTRSSSMHWGWARARRR